MANSADVSLCRPACPPSAIVTFFRLSSTNARTARLSTSDCTLDNAAPILLKGYRCRLAIGVSSASVRRKGRLAEDRGPCAHALPRRSCSQPHACTSLLWSAPNRNYLQGLDNGKTFGPAEDNIKFTFTYCKLASAHLTRTRDLSACLETDKQQCRLRPLRNPLDGLNWKGGPDNRPPPPLRVKWCLLVQDARAFKRVLILTCTGDLGSLKRSLPMIRLCPAMSIVTFHPRGLPPNHQQFSFLMPSLLYTHRALSPRSLIGARP